MKWTKSPPALVELFDGLVPDGAERRPMFGYPAAFVNGNLMASLFQDELLLRLDDESVSELLAAGGRPFAPMKGRPMRGFVVVPRALRSDGPALRAWVDRAFDHAQSMPPKPPKPRAAKSKNPPVSAKTKSVSKSRPSRARKGAK